jgi:nucleoside-diphosphate-sugar epimerase
VTGGAGYIGSHACKALATRGYEPVTYDNLSRGNRWAVKWGPLEEGEINDEMGLRAVLDRHQPVAVMHFAAFAYVGESVEQPLLYYQNNVGSSATLFRAIIATRTIPVVFSSTCAIYGVPEKIPIPEEHPQRPINPYGFSKLVVERILTDLGHAHGLRSIALRYFNAAGADPDGDIGEAHDPEPHLIPRVLAAARDGTAMTVYGDDYETSDGTCIRDYIHVGGYRRCTCSRARAPPVRWLELRTQLGQRAGIFSHGRDPSFATGGPKNYSFRDGAAPARRSAGAGRSGGPGARDARMGANTLGIGSADCRCVELDAKRGGPQRARPWTLRFSFMNSIPADLRKVHSEVDCFLKQ